MEIIVLKGYFEKRSGIPRRRKLDRRREIEGDDILLLMDFPNDIIPIFSNQGNRIIGHMSPGRRQGGDRRSGIERRQYLTE